ncbi:MAG: lytic transglycosylase domain-containing protein [Acidobacteria bacterium]|nr:MAG: lytic transglycosylase domain-containing protein [Acidobacteriota bacterium]
MNSGNSLRGFTTGDAQIDSYIVEFSNRYNIDPLLIYAQMHQESSFKKYAVSPKGARGLMQLMPATAKRFGVTDIFDPKQNIEGGVKYMRWLLDTFNQDLVLALAGYNAGEGAVMKYGWQVPPYSETREYVRRILLRYSMIQDPNIVKRMTKRVSQAQAKKLLQKEEPKPLKIYEPTPVVILVDGKPRLVTQ